MKRALRRAGGFTLIELMIVVAIIAVITAVALPSYTRHVARGKRADAAATLMEAAQFMERDYSAKGRYESGSLPARLQTSPANGSPNYNISLTVDATGTGYSLTATPLQSDECGALVLTNTGRKTRTGTGLTDAQCWR